jgi:hypothetical protein
MLSMRALSGTEQTALKNACLRELDGSHALQACTDFVEFCDLLARPENHVQVPSTQYVETQVNTYSTQEMINQMAQELVDLPRFTAYAKVVQAVNDTQIVRKAKIQTFALDEPQGLADVGGIARHNAIHASILRKRSDIDKEIIMRQAQWRRGPDDDPPPTSTGGDTPLSLPPGRPPSNSELPPPTHYIPDQSSEKKPQESSDILQPQTISDKTREAKGRQTGRILDFTSYLHKRRGVETSAVNSQADKAALQAFNHQQTPITDSIIPDYEPLEDTPRHDALQAFKVFLTPIADGWSAHSAHLSAYWLLQGPKLAIELELREIKWKVKSESWWPDGYTGIKVAWLGETELAEYIIQKLVEEDSVISDIHDFYAGEIAVLLPNKSMARQLLRQFEIAGNRGAALYIAVEISDTKAVDRLLEQIIEHGVRASGKGHLDKIIETLLKAVPHNPALGKKIVEVIEEEKEEQYLEDEVEYIGEAGKIAAILGEKAYAKWAIDCCLDKKMYLEAGAIAALSGEVTATENILAKFYQERGDSKLYRCNEVGFILASLAKHNPYAAERLWKTVETQDPEYVGQNAAAILRNLLSLPR